MAGNFMTPEEIQAENERRRKAGLPSLEEIGGGAGSAVDVPGLNYIPATEGEWAEKNAKAYQARKAAEAAKKAEDERVAGEISAKGKAYELKQDFPGYQSPTIEALKQLGGGGGEDWEPQPKPPMAPKGSKPAQVTPVADVPSTPLAQPKPSVGISDETPGAPKLPWSEKAAPEATKPAPTREIANGQLWKAIVDVAKEKGLGPLEIFKEIKKPGEERDTVMTRMAELAAAQEQDRQENNWTRGMGIAADAGLAALGRRDSEFANKIGAPTGKAVERYQERLRGEADANRMDDAMVERAREKRERDPGSEESKRARAFVIEYFPTLGKTVAGLSAAEIKDKMPFISKALEVDAEKYKAELGANTSIQIGAANNETQKAIGAGHDATSLTEARIRAAIETRNKRDATAKEEAKAAEKTAQGVREVQERHNNIKNRLQELKQRILDKGTFEATGPHNEILDQMVSDIATDYAKLMDPNSVARPSEVEEAKKQLFQPGTLKVKNQTVLDILDAFEKKVDSRLAEAYKVRGLDIPGTDGGSQKMEARPTGRVATHTDGSVWEELSDGSARRIR